MAGQSLRLHHGRDHEAGRREDGRSLRPRPSRRLGQGRLPPRLPAHGRPAALRPRGRQAGEHVPLRRRRHLGRAVLLLLRARPRPACGTGERQAGLVVPLLQRPGGQAPQLRHREAQHRPAGSGLAHGAVGRGRADQLGAQPLGVRDEPFHLPRPLSGASHLEHRGPPGQRRQLADLSRVLSGLRAHRPLRAAGLVTAPGGPARRSRRQGVPAPGQATARWRPGSGLGTRDDHAVPLRDRAEERLPLSHVLGRPAGLRGGAVRAGAVHRGAVRPSRNSR